MAPLANDSQDGGAMDVEPVQAAVASSSAGAAEAWRQCAIELQDEMQWHRDEVQRHRALLQAHAQASDDALMACDGAEDVHVLVEVDDPQDTRSSKKIDRKSVV